MRIASIWRLFALIFVLLLSPGVRAECLPGAPPVTEDDLSYPPPGMLVFRAEIVKILPHGPMRTKPHRGFGIDYKILEMVQGALPTDRISVEYGGCQSLPGQIGDVINVLAMRDRNVDWYAPEFWTRSK